MLVSIELNCKCRIDYGGTSYTSYTTSIYRERILVREYWYK